MKEFDNLEIKQRKNDDDPSFETDGSQKTHLERQSYKIQKKKFDVEKCVAEYLSVKQKTLEFQKKQKKINQKDKLLRLKEYGRQIKEKNPNINNEDFLTLIEVQDTVQNRHKQRNFWKQKRIKEQKTQDYENMTFNDGIDSLYQMTKNVIKFQEHKKEEMARKMCFFNGRIIKAKGCGQFINTGKCQFGNQCSKIHLSSWKEVSAYLVTDRSHYKIETEKDKQEKEKLDDKNKEYKKSQKRFSPEYHSGVDDSEDDSEDDSDSNNPEQN